MRLPQNVEKHPHIAGMYIGYNADGRAFRIRKDKSHSHYAQWRAVSSSMSLPNVTTLHAETLTALAKKLESAR